METKGTKTLHQVLIVEVCPNQEAHKQERIRKVKDAIISRAYPDTRPHHYCSECGARYIIGDDHKPQLTRKSYKELLAEVSKQALDRYEHPKKYLKEQKAYEKGQEENRNSEAYKLFEKGLKEGMKGEKIIKERSC